jgi:hypothetical protein
MSNGQPAPAVSPVRTEIQQILDVREKTAAALVKAEETRVTQVRELVKNYARQFATTEVDPARALDLHRQWKTRDDQSAERIAALQDLLVKVKQHVDLLKKDSTDDVAAVLKETIYRLLQESALHQNQNKALQDRINELQKELQAIQPPPVQARQAAPVPRGGAKRKTK